MNEFKVFSASSYEYTIIKKSTQGLLSPVYPYLKSLESYSNINMVNVSPLHGRSYIVDQTTSGRFVVIKGGGLNYSKHLFLRTPESQTDIWGILLENDAIRDYEIGNEISNLGIRTNHMQYVVELTNVPCFYDGKQLKPVLLQYDVECPYRIEDAPFIDNMSLWKYVHEWDRYNSNNYDQDYLIAADVLLSNLRKLHDAHILHNAMTTHNYTWSLELLDFEIASSPQFPYSKEDDERHKQVLFAREVLDVYRITKYIAHVLDQSVDEGLLSSMFKEYGYDLAAFAL